MRENANLLQKDVAEYLQCTQVSYSHYELGKRDIPTDVLMKLAAFYKTSTDHVMSETTISNGRVAFQHPWTRFGNISLSAPGF